MSKQAWEGQKGRERIPSRVCTVSTEPDVGLKFMNPEIMTWAKTKSQRINWLSHPYTPTAGVSEEMNRLILEFYVKMHAFISARITLEKKGTNCPILLYFKTYCKITVQYGIFMKIENRTVEYLKRVHIYTHMNVVNWFHCLPVI